jgi:hypothetical protein
MSGNKVSGAVGYLWIFFSRFFVDFSWTGHNFFRIFFVLLWSFLFTYSQTTYIILTGSKERIQGKVKRRATKLGLRPREGTAADEARVGPARNGPNARAARSRCVGKRPVTRLALRARTAS